MEGIAGAESSLVLKARDGDQEAFRTLYDQYFGKIYDFSYQLVRNREDAADVVSDTFIKAMENLGGLRDPAAFRGWLYSIARNASLNLIERRKRTSAMPDDFEPVAPQSGQSAAPDPAGIAEQQELATLVWQAAATLNPRDYSIFEMSVRQGLEPGEIAEALGVKPSHAYVLISRLKDTVEEALGAVVLSRAGRRDCVELDKIVGQFGDEVSPKMRKAVNRHLRKCDDCKSSKKKYASAAAILGGVAAAAPAAGLQEEIGARLDELWPDLGPQASDGSPSDGGGSDGGGSDGGPSDEPGHEPGESPPASPGGRRLHVSRSLTTATLAALVILLAVQAPGDPEPFTVDSLAQTEQPATATLVEVPGPDPEDSIEDAIEDEEPSDVATTAPATAVPAVTPGPPAATAPPPPAPGAPSVTAVSASPGVVYDGPCGARTSTVTASVDAPAGVQSVMLTASASGSTLSQNMTGSGGSYRATVGPYSSPGQVGLTVVVTDSQGRTARSGAAIVVQACPRPDPDPAPTEDPGRVQDPQQPVPQ